MKKTLNLLLGLFFLASTAYAFPRGGEINAAGGRISAGTLTFSAGTSLIMESAGGNLTLTGGTLDSPVVSFTAESPNNLTLTADKVVLNGRTELITGPLDTNGSYIVDNTELRLMRNDTDFNDGIYIGANGIDLFYYNIPAFNVFSEGYLKLTGFKWAWLNGPTGEHTRILGDNTGLSLLNQYASGDSSTFKLVDEGAQFTGTGGGNRYLLLPAQTTANRPTTPSNGMVRYNTTTNLFEGYENGAWTEITGRTKEVNFVIDGGGTVITAGVKGWIRIPYGATVDGWHLTADASGNLVVDVKAVAFGSWTGPGSATTVTGTETPTLTGAVSASDTTITTWTDPAADTVWVIEVTGTPATIARATLSVTLTRD